MAEKLVFLKREEIRTMAKDLAKLQEEEAIKEKEKISKLKLEENLAKSISQQEKIISTMIPGGNEIFEEKDAGEEISSKIGKTPPWKKILVRIFIVFSFFVFLFLIGFAYWYLVIKKRQNPQPSPTPSASVSPSPTESTNPEIPPIPVIAVKEIKIIDLNQEENVQEQLKQAIGNIVITSNEPEFLEILPKKDNQFWGLKSLAESLELGLPENFLASVSDEIKDFDFLLYIKETANLEIGFIVKMNDKEATIRAVKNWEKTMATDLAGLLKIIGREGTVSGSLFKQASYDSNIFYYLSSGSADSGIYWSTYNDYFFLATSEESMIKLFDKLAQKEPATLTIPPITERIVSWGYRIPAIARTIDTIIIHSTYNTLGEDPYDIEKIIQEHQTYKVTAHLLINREGAIYRLAPDEAVAYHAGTGKMPDGNRQNVINNFSIGIELVHTKTEPPNEAQYQSLAQIVKYLKQKYNITSENVLANYQISPGRKDDPWNFDWDHFNSLMK